MTNHIDLRHFEQLDGLRLIAEQIVAGYITGLHKSPYHGFSAEFAEHRQYNAGESIKNIDWKIFAKTERLFVKQFEEETNLRCQFVLDISSSMLFPVSQNTKNKLSFAIYCIASLAYICKYQRDGIGLTLLSETIEKHLSAHLNTLHLDEFYDILENLLESSKKKPYIMKGCLPKALHQVAEVTPKRSLVAIFSDFQESDTKDLVSAIHHLRYNKNEVILFQIVDYYWEQDLNYDSRPTQFVDLESNEVFSINPTELRESFSSEVAQQFKQLKIQCNELGVSLCQFNIRDPYAKVIQEYLIQRSKQV